MCSVQIFYIFFEGVSVCFLFVPIFQSAFACVCEVQYLY